MNSKAKKIIPILILLIIAAVVVKFVFFKSTFLYAGTMEVTKVDVSARVNSQISSLDVIEGQHIKEGQTLLKLSCEDYKIAADLADSNFDRTSKLYKQGSQSQDSLDQFKNRKEDSDLKVSWCDVKSPLTGTVLNKYHEVGEWVTQGTRLFTLANIKEPYAYIYVPQTLIAKISLGQKLTGYLPELNMRPFEGTITKIGETAEFTPKNVQTREERTRLVFEVKVSFQNEDETLKPGMSLEVKIPE